MSTLIEKLDAEVIRSSLAGFWRDALDFGKAGDGLAVAVPQTDPGGWQQVIDLRPTGSGPVRISDSGRTLAAVAGRGQNIDGDMITARIAEILKSHAVEREGDELFILRRLPFEPVDLHVFTEALVAISHLHVLHTPEERTQDIAGLTLRRVFKDRRLSPKENFVLSGKTERQIRVDFFVDELRRPVAFEILRRKRHILPTMEQWGYRWGDLRKVTPTLRPVMLYDRNTQDIDMASRAIGDEVCDLFCSYDETDRIHELLAQG